MTKWNAAVDDTFISNTPPQVTRSMYPFLSFRFGALINRHETGKLPLLTFSIFLPEVNILLPMSGTSN